MVGGADVVVGEEDGEEVVAVVVSLIGSSSTSSLWALMTKVRRLGVRADFVPYQEGPKVPQCWHARHCFAGEGKGAYGGLHCCSHWNVVHVHKCCGAQRAPMASLLCFTFIAVVCCKERKLKII